MKYLVLGSSGQIGKPYVMYLRNMGHTVREFDILRDKEEDLRVPNNKMLYRALDWADYVIFLAWDVGGAPYLIKHQNTYQFIINNAAIATNTFKALEYYQTPFIFASSQMANMSFSSYGVTKTLGELLSNSINGRVVKFWNVYGPEHDYARSHVISDFIRKAKLTKIIDMMTDGKEERQFLHVDDCSRALYTISQKHFTISPTIPLHIASFEWNNILDIATIIKELLPEITIIPGISSDITQKGIRNEPDKSILSLWQPSITLKEGIKMIMREGN